MGKGQAGEIVVLSVLPGKGEHIPFVESEYDMHGNFRDLCSRMLGLMLQEDGQDLAECGLVILLVATGAVALLSNMGSELAATYKTINTAFP